MENNGADNGLRELVKNLEMQRQSAKDYVCLTKHMKAMVSQLGRGVVVDIEGVGTFKPNNYAHGQVATKCGIPQKYYDHVHVTNKPLLVDMINNDIQRDVEKRLVRTMVVDDEPVIRAMLSDRFKVIDNYDVLFKTLEAIRGSDVRVERADLSDTNMYVRIVSPKKYEVSVGDEVQRGVIIRNSEVGAGAFKIEPFVLRLVCSNGMIGESVVDRVHLGRKMEVGEVFTEQTRTLENAALLSQVGDIINATFNDEVAFQAWLEQMKIAKATPIEKPIEVTQILAKKYKLSENDRVDILNEFCSDTLAGRNLWGLVNGITAVAKTKDADRRTELEELANTVLTDRKLCAIEVQA